MSQLPLLTLTHEAFAPFGSFCDFFSTDKACIGAPPITFYRDMLPLRLGRDTCASFSICKCEPRPALIDFAEYHSCTEEFLLPLDSDVMFFVAPATSPGDMCPADRISIFKIPLGVGITLRPGIWHHAPFACTQKSASVLVVLPERTYANDTVSGPLKQSIAFSL